MDIHVLELRTRIATLEGQKSQADAELGQLRQIPCPHCNGDGNIEKVVEGENASGTYMDNCKLCQGSGKAAGQQRY